jgi:hypothetical protein
VKSLDKLAQRTCLALLLLPVAWVVLVVPSFCWDDLAMERFYRNRPILRRVSLRKAPAVLRRASGVWTAGVRPVWIHGLERRPAIRRRRPPHRSEGREVEHISIGSSIWCR